MRIVKIKKIKKTSLFLFLFLSVFYLIPSVSSATFSGARVYYNTTQSIDNSTETNVLFNSEDFDTNSYHSTSTDTDRLTIPTTGYYHFGYSVVFQANSTGGRKSRIVLNGSDTILRDNTSYSSNSVDDSLGNSSAFYFTAGDYIQLKVRQFSGSSLNLLGGALTTNPTFWAYQIDVPSGSGSVDWGDIGGTLSNQTDLQSALDSLTPFTLPDQTGNTGLFLSTDGVDPFWDTPAGGGGGDTIVNTFNDTTVWSIQFLIAFIVFISMFFLSMYIVKKFV